MNCLPVLPRCKAECCGPCPIPLAQYQRNLRRRARKRIAARGDLRPHLDAQARETAGQLALMDGEDA